MVAVVAVAAVVTVVTAGTCSVVAATMAGAAKGAVAGFVSGAISGAAEGAVTHVITTGSFDCVGEAALNGMADGALTGAISGAISGGMSGYSDFKANPQCFVAGTLIKRDSADTPIEDIEIGDYVWAWDEDAGEVALKRVADTYVNESHELIHVFVNGEEIITTPTHLFYSPVKGWTDAVRLRAGDILVLVNSEYVVVEKVQHEILEAPVIVYNFQVEDYHTYYVANIGVLVHNKCIIMDNGVSVDVRTSNEHGVPHAHVSGNGKNTTIGLDGIPMKGHPPLSKAQKKVIQNNWDEIKNGIITWFNGGIKK